MAGLSFGVAVKPKPFLRPMYNIGCLFDIQTGSYVLGKNGEAILNGGLALLTGVCGLPNTYKSTIAHYMLLTVMDRIVQANGQVYDTEMSVSENRFQQFARRYDNLVKENLFYDVDTNPEGRLLLTDAATVKGDIWFEETKKYADMKMDKVNIKKVTGVTPFMSKRSGVLFEAMYPSISEIDSLSRMPITSVDAILDKNAVGESGNNVEAFRSSHAKNQLLIQTPVLTAGAAMPMIMTAHVSDKLVLDAYAPDVKKLAFLKGNLKLKYVPDQFNFLMNNLWFCFSAVKLVNQNTKAAEYPRNSDDTDKQSSDLMCITLMNLRGKYGASGLPYEYIVSQSEGILVGLTEFNYLKQYDRFGLGGNLMNYHLELYPDVNLSRTTIRSKLDQDPLLCRAMEITSELCQIKNLWHDLPKGLFKTPLEIRTKLTELGYDWNILLSTRGYWVFEGSNHPKEFLSTMDLMRMAGQTYHPYWYDDYCKRNNIVNKVKWHLEPGALAKEPENFAAEINV
jgi:hypothetical protein